jgi:hypothetical protein
MKFKDVLLEKFMVRKNKKQKTKFINWIMDEFKDSDFCVNIEKGVFGVRNIVIGDVEKSDVVFTAHYDTCVELPVPNICTPTNVLLYLVLQTLFILPFMMLVAGGAVILAYLFPTLSAYSDDIYFGSLLFLLVYLFFGPANKTTVNDNTSGVLTILEMINKIPNELKNKVAFVLFDHEETGLWGSSSFASKHKKEMKNKLLINFDCVSDGDKMLFIFNKKAKNNFDLLKDSYVSTDKVESQMVLKNSIFPSDQVNFQNAIGVCSVIRGESF